MIHEYFIAVLAYILIYTIVVVSLNLAFGFTGLVNLGHMAFFGLGAYTSALLTLHGIPWYIALPASGLVAGIFGAVIAAITVRLKGDYFQIVALGLAFIAIAVSRNWISLTRGALGLPGIPDIIENNLGYMLFLFAVACLSVIFLHWLTSSETGKIFQAIRDDETAAAVLGKNTYLYKILSIAKDKRKDPSDEGSFVKDLFVFGYYDRDLTVRAGIFCLSPLSRYSFHCSAYF